MMLLTSILINVLNLQGPLSLEVYAIMRSVQRNLIFKTAVQTHKV
jgi:hypothetical protein